MPIFAPDGRSIFFRGLAGSLLEAGVTTGMPIGLQAPQQILARGIPTQLNGPSYTTVDGERFLMATRVLVRGDEFDPTPRLIVTLNWFEELKRVAPPGGR